MRFQILLLILATITRGAIEQPLAWGQDAAALDPFAPRERRRTDTIPGFVELSDGTVHPGQIYLTRDARLKIFDVARNRAREVPLAAVRRIECSVKKEWTEKEWRFKENANDQKVYSGRSYPVREYSHSITLSDGRIIQGPLSAIIYVSDDHEQEPERFLLHERDKGHAGTELKSLIYVRVIELGEKALEQGKQEVRKAAAGREQKRAGSR